MYASLNSFNFLKEKTMKTIFALAAGAASVLSSGVTLAQSGHMMNGAMWGGGWMGAGYWPLILLCIAVIGLVVWIITKKGK